METQEIINQVKQENQENDIIMSNQEIREKVRQQMNKTGNPWLERYPELDKNTLELFRKEYCGTWEVTKPNSCQACPNYKLNRICHCTLGSMVIEA